jgi:hypothetical protein
MNMSTKNIIESKSFKVAAAICGVLLIALLSFALGVRVGFYKALYSSQWGKNYERNFLGSGEERGGRSQEKWGGMMGSGGMRNAHGVAGEILSLNDKTVMIKDLDQEENTILVTDNTIIRRGNETMKLGDLVVGERIVVMGRPGNDGVIAARLIRIFNVDTRPSL